MRIGREPEGPVTAPRKSVTEQHSPDAVSHGARTHSYLIEVRFTVNEAKRDESDWLVLEIDCDVSQLSFDRRGPARRFGKDKGVVRFECELEPCLSIKFAGFIVDGDEFL